MIQMLAVGLWCLASAAAADVNIDSSHSHNILDLKLRNSHSHLGLSPLSLVGVDANSVSANATAPWAAGSVCTDEGEWNCLTTCWQRCASGVWSDTMALAEGTVCAPVGLSHDMTLSPLSASVGRTSASENLSTIMAATTGLCQCTTGGCLSTPPSTSPSSTATTTAATTATTTSTSSSSKESSTGDFISGSSSAAKKQPASTVTVVAGVGMLAVVFARLLM